MKARRPGRPRLPKGEARTIQVCVRLTRDEHARLAAGAERQGQAIGSYLRALATRD